MKITLLAVGQKMPAWVEKGYLEYSNRLRGSIKLELREIAPAKRTSNSVTERIKLEEAQRLLAAVPDRALIVALDEHGKTVSTRAMAQQLGVWIDQSQDIAIIIGGPDGLDKTLLDQAQVKWSLSKLTFPHPLVRVILAEQVYRAWSLLQNHPYHRE